MKIYVPKWYHYQFASSLSFPEICGSGESDFCPLHSGNSANRLSPVSVWQGQAEHSLCILQCTQVVLPFLYVTEILFIQADERGQSFHAHDTLNAQRAELRLASHFPGQH